MVLGQVVFENSYTYIGMYTVLSLLEVHGAKTLSSALLFHAILCVMATIAISNNTVHVWTIYLYMDSVKFVLETPGIQTLTGALLFCGDAAILWQLADPFCGVLLLGRALLIGTLQYVGVPFICLYFLLNRSTEATLWLKQEIVILPVDVWLELVALISAPEFSPYGSGHEGLAVLLPGFAINW